MYKNVRGNNKTKKNHAIYFGNNILTGCPAANWIKSGSFRVIYWIMLWLFVWFFRVLNEGFYLIKMLLINKEGRKYDQQKVHFWKFRKTGHFNPNSRVVKATCYNSGCKGLRVFWVCQTPCLKCNDIQT